MKGDLRKNMEREEIKQIMLKLKFNINSKGFDYWIQAIHIYTTFKNISMKELYNQLAFEFNTPKTAVERALRTASKQACNNIHKYFNYDGKITNSVILKLFRFYYDITDFQNHITNPFFQFFYAFGLGCLFGLVYVKTGKLIYTVLYHMAINLLGGVLAPWIIEKIDLENLMTIMETIAMAETPDMTLLEPYAGPLALLLVYDLVIYGTGIAGTILLFRARKRHSLDTGLLPPPKKGRVGNIFLNAGVACALTAFAGLFLLSLL